MKYYCLFIVSVFLFCGCYSGGTHGSIKGYRYAVSKPELEKVVQQIILEKPEIIQDSVKRHFNDDIRYVTISIIENGLPYTYTFRYYGGEAYWDTSMTSAVFIVYAYNANHEGGSEGGRIKQHGDKFIRNLIMPFEKEFI